MSSPFHTHKSLTASVPAQASAVVMGDEIADFGPASFTTARLQTLGVATAGVINVGIWTSYDGKTWWEWFRSADVAADAAASAFVVCPFHGTGAPVVVGRWVDEVTGSMAGTPELTFADDDPDTITRDAGSWVDDGFAVNDVITVTGTVSNDGTYRLAAVTATVLTLYGADELAAEVLDPAPAATVTSKAAPAPVLAKGTTAPGLPGTRYRVVFECDGDVAAAAEQIVEIHAHRT